MLTTIAMAVSVVAARPTVSGKPSDVRDIHAVEAIVTAFPTAWNKADMKSFAELFDDDADFVVITGKRLVGRTQITSYHADLIAKLYNSSHLAWTITDVRFLTPTVALVHVATEISFRQGKDHRTSVALVVLDKRHGSWKIASLQNTLTGGVPLGGSRP